MLAYKSCEKLVFLNCSTVSEITTTAGATIWTLPSSIRPYSAVNVIDATTKYRFQIGADGKISSVSSITNQAPRFSIAYYTN